jgi:curved DNA-binding protein
VRTAAAPLADHYATLGVPADATPEDIKQAYRKLARQYHPDVSALPDAEARFKAIGEANQVLRDPAQRAEYDSQRVRSGMRRRGAAGPGPGNDPRGQSPEMDEILEAFLGRQRRAGKGRGKAARRPGEDYHSQLLVDLADAYTGATRSVHLQLQVRGDAGRDQVVERRLDVHIPRGLRAGQRLRLAGQGGPGLGQQSLAGDLYLEVSFRPHPLFRVDGGGRDVYLDLPLAPWEAALGATVEVPLPVGRVALTVPAHSGQGTTLRLAGQGLPGPTPGHLYAVVRIVLPRADNPAAMKSYADMAVALAFDPRAGFHT